MCISAGGGMSNRSFNALTVEQQMRTLSDLQKQISRAKAAETKANNEYLLAEGAVQMTYANDVKRRREREKVASKARTKKNRKTAERQKLQTRLDRYSRQYHKDFDEQTSLF